jgi:hypothetical protein
MRILRSKQDQVEELLGEHTQNIKHVVEYIQNHEIRITYARAFVNNLQST